MTSRWWSELCHKKTSTALLKYTSPKGPPDSAAADADMRLPKGGRRPSSWKTREAEGREIEESAARTAEDLFRLVNIVRYTKACGLKAALR